MTTQKKGPADDTEWPDALNSAVTETSADDIRIHGYSVGRDLVRHYSFAEQLFVYLTGKCPDRETGRAFEVALGMLAPVDAGEAPAHSAVLARLCGASTSATIGSTALVLAEQADELLHRESSTAVGDQGLETLRDALPGPFAAKLKSEESMAANALAVLRHCGLESDEQLISALTVARLVPALVNALQVTPGAFQEYPTDLPTVEYHEDQ